MDRLLVLIGACGLIGVLFYWFFGAKRDTAVEATIEGGTQYAEIIVDGGYNPGTVILRQGIPAELTFIRKDPSGCLEQVVFPDIGVSKKLPVGAPRVIRFTPDSVGEMTYVCGMSMFFGKVIIK